MLDLIYSFSTQKDTSNQMLYIHQYIEDCCFTLYYYYSSSLDLSFHSPDAPPCYSLLYYYTLDWSSLSLFLVRIRRIIIHSHHSKLSTSYILFQPPTRLDYYIILYKILCCCWAPLEFPFLSFLFVHSFAFEPFPVVWQRLNRRVVERRMKKMYLNFSRDDD